MRYSVKINGTTYTCISSFTPSVTPSYWYDVVTLDGQRHRSLKGVKTNYEIVFFNDLSGKYEVLKKVLGGNNTVELVVPTSGNKEITANFFPMIKSYSAKGFLSSGEFFENGLKVSFEKVGFDE